MDNKYSSQKLVICGFGIALIFLMTAFIAIPMPGMGYVNIGDTGIMLFSTILGPYASFAVSAIASALGDIYLGYSQYAIFTFIIKGVEGLIISRTFKKFQGKKSFFSYLFGVLLMVIGYYFTDVLLLGNWAAPIPGVLGNIGQGSICALLAIAAQKTFMRIASNQKKLMD